MLVSEPIPPQVEGGSELVIGQTVMIVSRTKQGLNRPDVGVNCLCVVFKSTFALTAPQL